MVRRPVFVPESGKPYVSEISLDFEYFPGSSIQQKQVSPTEVEVVFTAKIDQGWHVYSTNLPADGPTSIYLAAKLAPHLLGAIAVAAYSYMSLVPLIQPPVMKLFTTQKEREIVMEQLREVTRFEKIVFPIVATIFISLLLPSITSLLGMLMLGNLFRESGVTERLSDTSQNALINTVTIFLATGTGLTMSAEHFLSFETIKIILLGLFAFICGTAGGVLFGKLMSLVDGGKTNPLIGSAGVSAVPMAARVSQVVGAKANPANFLLMHAMGPNVAGVIGTAVAAGTMLAMLSNH